MGSLVATIQSNPTTAAMTLGAALLIGAFFYLCARFLIALARRVEDGIVEAVIERERPSRLLGSRRPPVGSTALRRRA